MLLWKEVSSGGRQGSALVSVLFGIIIKDAEEGADGMVLGGRAKLWNESQCTGTYFPVTCLGTGNVLFGVRVWVQDLPLSFITSMIWERELGKCERFGMGGSGSETQPCCLLPA